MTEKIILLAHSGHSTPVDIANSLGSLKEKVVTTPLKGIESALTKHYPSCVVLVMTEGERTTVERVLQTVKGMDDNLPFLALVESSTLEDAVEIMKAGAYDFFSLPVDAEKLCHSVANAIKLYTLIKRVYLLENQMGWRGQFEEIVGQGPTMQEIFNMVEMVAKSNATVLIQGESGTGKELVAKAVHRKGPRAKKIFLDINCGAIPHELLENEMFGHERGAFTGADRRYIGSLERADGGTLFLDEISEMDMSLQVKLLRFLQERTLIRVGGNQQIPVDVRIVAATNRNLAKEVEEGRFREDLYYRLNVVPVTLPPLRERREDIPLLAKHFLEKYSSKNEKIFIDFAPEALEKLVAYDWPGNVRELENTIERIIVLHNDSRVKLSHLSPQIQSSSKSSPSKSFPIGIPVENSGKILPLELIERYAIENALERCLGNVNEAAGKLKIGQATLYRKIKQYGLII